MCGPAPVREVERRLAASLRRRVRAGREQQLHDRLVAVVRRNVERRGAASLPPGVRARVCVRERERRGVRASEREGEGARAREAAAAAGEGAGGPRVRRRLSSPTRPAVPQRARGPPVVAGGAQF